MFEMGNCFLELDILDVNHVKGTGMYGNGEFVPRDLYDLCTAAEKDPRSLRLALGILTGSEREEIAGEIKSFGFRASGLGRELVAVHRPEWLSGIGRRTADLILSPPEVRPDPVQGS